MNLETLQDFCLSLPRAKEDVKWEDNLCFTIAEKIFCITGFKDSSGVCVKVSSEDFEDLTEREGIVQAKYFAKRQWVLVEKRSALKTKEWEYYITKSYNLVKSKLPKKIQKEIDGL